MFVKSPRIFPSFLVLLAVTFGAGSALAQQTGSSRTGTVPTPRSSGGLFFEPMITGEVSDSEIKTSQLPIISDDTSGRVEAAGLGLRFGGHVAETFFVAADGRYSRGNLRDSSYENATSTGYNYGLTVGGQTPFWGLRAWGTAVLGGELDPGVGANGFDVKFRDPRGYRVGAGLHIAAVAVNLEYQELTYQNSDLQSIGDLNIDAGSNVDFESRGAVLSLGFPIEL